MTDKEKLSCLIDRPCTACELHKEEGCSKWSCVFDQKSELPEGEYIKKTDVLDKAVIETLSDYTEYDVVHVDEINKLPTFSVPEIEKGEFEGMTNGEVFQAIFPCDEVHINGLQEGYVHFSMKSNSDSMDCFNLEWWNAPYKPEKGGE